MKTTIKTYIVSAATSTREIQARNKREAEELFKAQVRAFISEGDKITVK